jgi:hypothetical protein
MLSLQFSDNQNVAKRMQEVRAASFHLHKARIMSASLQLPDHFEVHGECPFAGVGSNVRIRI